VAKIDKKTELTGRSQLGRQRSTLDWVQSKTKKRKRIYSVVQCLWFISV